jgi:transcriptional regulator with XRE-family HTH domain
MTMVKRERVVHPEFAEWLEREARKGLEWGHQYAIMELTRLVLEAMEAQGVTQAELARRAGYQPSYVSRLLNNPENITMRTAFRLCNALDLELGFDIKPKAEPLHQPETQPERKPKTKSSSAAKPARKSVAV